MHARQSAERRGARGGGATVGDTNSSTAPSRGCTVVGRAALSGSTMTVCDGIATPGWKCGPAVLDCRSASRGAAELLFT